MISFVILQIVPNANIQLISTIVENIYKISLALAAILTSYFGSTILLKQLERKKRIAYFRRKFPIENVPDHWRLVKREGDANSIFLYDKDHNVYHHITNMDTLRDLKWDFLERKETKLRVFITYKEGEPIQTNVEIWD